MWDAWINKKLPPLTYRARKRYSLDSPLIEHDADSLNEKLPVVCRQCNNGWMSVLSLKVKDRFERAILDAEPFSLGPRDAAILAAFTFMKAVVTNHLTIQPFFTRAVRRQFKDSLAIPPVTQMWVAVFHGESFMSTRSNFGVNGTKQLGPLFNIEFGSFTYVVGHLVLQLLAPRWKRVKHSGRPLGTLTPGSGWNPVTTLFWPHSGTVVSWPPSKYFSDDSIQTFIYRFIDNPISRAIP
jgi:hypothetical protein